MCIAMHWYALACIGVYLIGVCGCIGVHCALWQYLCLVSVLRRAKGACFGVTFRVCLTAFFHCFFVVGDMTCQPGGWGMPRKVFGFVAVLPSLRLVFFALSWRVVVVAGVVKSVAAGSVVPMLVDPGGNAGLCAAGMVIVVGLFRVVRLGL